MPGDRVIGRDDSAGFEESWMVTSLRTGAGWAELRDDLTCGSCDLVVFMLHPEREQAQGRPQTAQELRAHTRTQ